MRSVNLKASQVIKNCYPALLLMHLIYFDSVGRLCDEYPYLTCHYHLDFGLLWQTVTEAGSWSWSGISFSWLFLWGVLLSDWLHWSAHKYSWTESSHKGKILSLSLFTRSLLAAPSNNCLMHWTIASNSSEFTMSIETLSWDPRMTYFIS